jgi:hypothetical protein
MGALYRVPAADEVPHQRDRGHDQQQVYQAPGDMKHDESEDPADEKDQEEDEKHDDLPRGQA